MDPFSIIVGSASLVDAVVKVTNTISRFIKDFNDARPEMIRISDDLQVLKQMLELLGPEFYSTIDEESGFNGHLKDQINSCMDIVHELEQLIDLFQKSRASWALTGKSAVKEMEKKLKWSLQYLKLALNIEGLSLSKDIKRGTDEIAERLEHMSAQLDHLSRQSGFANRSDFLQPNCSRSSTHYRIDHDIGETTDTGTIWQDCGSSGSYHSLNSTDIMDTCRTTSPAVQDPLSATFSSSSWWSGSTLLSDESAYSQANAAPEWNNSQLSVSLLETEEMGASLSLCADDNPWTESNQSLSWYPSTLIDICPPALSPIAQLEKQPQVDPSTESIRDQFKRRVKALAPSRQPPTSTSSFSNSTSWYEKPRKTTNPTAKRFLEQVKLKARSTTI